MVQEASPPPTDRQSVDLVDGFEAVYGRHAGARAAHARGHLCRATFHPAADTSFGLVAEWLINGDRHAVVRFSNGGGDPNGPDGTNEPRGMAVKFTVPSGTADLVMLSLPVFFSRTVDDLLAFNQARRPDPATGGPDMAAMGAFLESHPETVPSITAVMTHPFVDSYATLAYHGLHAFGFDRADGTTMWGRTHLVADAQPVPITAEEAAAAPNEFLRDELAIRLSAGPVMFTLELQPAGPGDLLDDPTALWPGTERTVLGQLAVEGFTDERERDGDILVFDPTRVGTGVQLSADPILLARPGAYAVSVERRTA
jgi:catalase